jgi:hypothetical protein
VVPAGYKRIERARSFVPAAAGAGRLTALRLRSLTPGRRSLGVLGLSRDAEPLALVLLDAMMRCSGQLADDRLFGLRGRQS